MALPQDKEDTLINPLMSFVDLGHGLAVLVLRAGAAGGGCGGYPVVALQRQLAAGYLFVAGWISAVLKHRRLGRTANRPVRARVYFPIHHDAIECHVRRPLPAAWEGAWEGWRCEGWWWWSGGCPTQRWFYGRHPLARERGSRRRN